MLCRFKDHAVVLDLMFKQGFTRRSFAEACGVHYSTMAYYLVGDRNPSLVVAKKIAAKLNVEFSQIFVFGQRKPRKQ